VKQFSDLRESLVEAKELTYTVVHAKKGKVVVTAPTSYDAAQKAAKKWKLKSTGGVDAYLMKESVELDEAMGKLNAKGEIEMTAKNYAKVHKDYKTKMKGVPYAMQIDPKTGGSALYPVKIIKESVEVTEKVDKDNDYRRVSKAVKQTPKHRRDKVAMASQPAKTDAKAVARRKAIEKHQERMRAKKDNYWDESVDEGAENYTVKKGPYTRKVDGKTADKMKRQGWKLVAREEVEEARQMKDPKKDSMITKGGKTIVIDKSKEKEYLKKGWTLAESTNLEEGKMKEFHDYIDQGKSAQWIAKKMGLDMKTVKELMADMKESVELDEAYQQFLDKTPNWGEDKAISYGRKKGYKEIGVCGHGKIDGIVLFGMDAGDKAYVGKEAKVKTGQTVFRYATKRTVAGDIFPLVKIDVKRGILYNLSQKSSEGEIEHAEFETKGVKLRYLRLLASANLRDITGFDPGFGSMKESTAPKTLSDIRETK